jgi:hypothetical protein
VTNQVWVCDQPVRELATNGLPLIVEHTISNSASANSGENGAVRLLDGCSGDGTSATDLVLHINGNGNDLGTANDGLVLVRAHDLEIEGYVNCGRPQGGAHQDGVQMNYGHRITFRNFTSGNVSSPDPQNWEPTCHGAGGIFYVSQLNDNDSELTNVVCEGCKMAGSTYGTVGTGLSIYGSTDSGARNSIFAARNPCHVESSSSGNGPTRPVNVNNTCVTTN